MRHHSRSADKIRALHTMEKVLRILLPLQVCLFIMVFLPACMSTSELPREDIQHLWSPEETFYPADLRVDASTGTYEFDANSVTIESTERGTEIVGRQKWYSYDTLTSFRIPWKDVSRLWYDEDIVVYVRDGPKLQLNAGEWYMAVEGGRVTFLVPVLAISDTLLSPAQGQDVRLKAGDIYRIEFPETFDWASTVAYSFIVVLAIVAALSVVYIVAISINPWK